MELSELSKLCDAYQTLRAVRLSQEKAAEATKKEENKAKEEIITELRETEVPVIGGTTHNFERVVKDEPQADDWDEIYAYIYEHKAWELLHKRLGTAAVKERWDAGEEIPGVGAYPVESLSVTKHK
jgi:tagatose-1,6-bisphosphate aldolase non-catalytic subunit AgaZ/GatZ